MKYRTRIYYTEAQKSFDVGPLAKRRVPELDRAAL